MKIGVDQSGKIENTNKPTVVAFSNSQTGSVVILAAEKKKLQRYFRQLGKPELFVPLGFAAAIFELVENRFRKGDQIVVDREYPGYEKFITRKLKEFILEGSKIKDVDIAVTQISKKSKAHTIAYAVAKKKSRQALRKISARDLIKIIKKNLKSGSA